MFEELTNRFEPIFKKLKGRGKLSEDNISEAMRDVKRALLEADVNYKVVKQFTKGVKEKALGSSVLQSVSPGQQFVKVVYDELSSFMGGQAKTSYFHTNRVNTVLLAGLQGSGKTTACSKLALYYRKQGHRPLLVACDTHRAAAIDQLESLGRSLNIPVYSSRDKDPVTICRDGLKFAKKEGCSLVIVDTAGRLHIDSGMMSELKDVYNAADPEETFFVADAMTGQDAVRVAKEFYDVIKFTGVMLTKMDGDARGGAALSILNVTGVPVQFIGTGEKPDALERFHPERIASRILGMGDVVSLVEKAQDSFDAQKSLKLQKRLRRNAFTFQDFLEQLQAIKKMGSIQDLLSMIPGVGNSLSQADVDPGIMKRIEAIICSMTIKERAKPDLLNGSRRRRIANGSGTTIQDVNKLIKQFGTMKKMIKQMNKKSGKAGKQAALKNVLS